jgi:nonsense-mediated mRNA decay protein 3
MSTMAAAAATAAAAQQQKQVRILCCVCGVPMVSGNTANTCAGCLANSADITKNISTSSILHQCRGCQRWNAGTNAKWVSCDLESRELLAICLQHVSGLKQQNAKQGVRLTDAVWIWTEPHSMRLKVKLTVQRQVMSGTVLQQSFVVEFIVRNQQCTECTADSRAGSWKALIQVRQRVAHKRTFLYLEQLILKHRAQRGCLKIEIFKDGMDFYFGERNSGARFVHFVESVAPCRTKSSKKLISTDDKNNCANIKYTYLVDILPLCKDDLLYLPASLATKMGSMERLVLVQRVTDQVHVVDPQSGHTGTFSSEEYWRDPVRAIVTAHRSRFTEFLVLGKSAVELERNPAQRQSSRQTAQRVASVTFCRSNHVGLDKDAEETSHVGYLLKEGDYCVGYDLRDTQFSENDIGSNVVIPDAILVRKLYSGKRSPSQQRLWKLRRLEEQVVVDRDERMNDKGGDDDEDDEDFMQEVEADKEMRRNINLYKKNISNNNNNVAANDAEDDEDDDDMDNDEDDQHVQLDELLDELDLEAAPDQEDDGDAAAVMVPLPGTIDQEGARHVKDKESANLVSVLAAEFRPV